MQFDHIGLITTEKKENDIYIAPTKVWITEFEKHPFRIEWLRYEPDSPVTGPVREKPHVAFRVDDIEAASQGMKVLLEPFDVGFAVVAFFETEDGAVVELMKYKETEETKDQ
jgi:catechol 2,3-dioxygenase-like lactoylglutathione lyase family enzyme